MLWTCEDTECKVTTKFDVVEMDKDAKCHGISHANKNWLCFLCAAIHKNPHS